MGKRGYEDSACSIARTLGVLSDAWTMMILREAFLGTRRFADFETHLDISKNVLSQRLQHLVDHEVLERIDAGQHGKRFEYRLTPRGKDLYTLITALRQWGDRWLFGEGNEPLLVIDRQTGEPIEPIRLRRNDGTLIPSHDLEMVPGPGASEESRRRYERKK